METITNLTQLNARIAVLTANQTNEELLLKEQLTITYDNLKQLNLITTTIKNILAPPNFKGNVINAVLSYATGYVAKSIVVGSTHNPIKQLLGVLLQTGISSIVSKNATDIKSVLANFIKDNFQPKQP